MAKPPPTPKLVGKLLVPNVGTVFPVPNENRPPVAGFSLEEFVVDVGNNEDVVVVVVVCVGGFEVGSDTVGFDAFGNNVLVGVVIVGGNVFVTDD